MAKGVVKNRLTERSYEVELPQVHLGKTSEPPATTDDTNHEQCNQPQPQEPVTETYELPSQSAVEVTTEVPPPATEYVRRARNILRTMF